MAKIAEGVGGGGGGGHFISNGDIPVYLSGGGGGGGHFISNGDIPVYHFFHIRYLTRTLITNLRLRPLSFTIMPEAQCDENLCS